MKTNPIISYQQRPMYNCPPKHPNFTLCLSLSLSFCLIMCWVPNLITNFRFQHQVMMSIPTTSHQYLSCIASWLHTGSSLSLMCSVDPLHLSHSCPKVVSIFTNLYQICPKLFSKWSQSPKVLLSILISPQVFSEFDVYSRPSIRRHIQLLTSDPIAGN